MFAKCRMKLGNLVASYLIRYTVRMIQNMKHSYFRFKEYKLLIFIMDIVHRNVPRSYDISKDFLHYYFVKYFGFYTFNNNTIQNQYYVQVCDHEIWKQKECKT